MTMEQSRHMTFCNALGIRIFPVPRGVFYFLVVEFNELKDFSLRASKIIEGKKLYHSLSTEWTEKIHEGYKHYFNAQKKIDKKKKERWQMAEARRQIL